MIVVKVELWGAQTGKVRELFRMTLSNDGTQGDGNKGNYDVALYRKGMEIIHDGPDRNRIVRPGSVLRRGRVENFPRKSYHTGRLVLRALKSVFPEEK